MKADAERQLTNDTWDKYYSPHRHPYMHSHRIGYLVAQEKLLDVCNPCKILHKAEIPEKAGRRNYARQTKNNSRKLEPTIYCKNCREAVKNKIESKMREKQVQNCLDPSESSVNDAKKKANDNQRNVRNSNRNRKRTATCEVEKRVTKTTQRPISPRQKSSN